MAFGHVATQTVAGSDSVTKASSPSDSRDAPGPGHQLDRYGHLLPGVEDRVNDALDAMAAAPAAVSATSARHRRAMEAVRRVCVRHENLR